MSDHIVQPYHDSDATAQKSVHPYQSAWMTHWMRTSCKSAPQVHTNLSLHYEDKEDDHDTKQRPFPSGLEIASDISKSVKGFREVTEARTVKTLNESLTIGTKNLRNEKLDCQPFPMFNLSRNRENTLASKNDQSAICHRGVLRSQLDHSSGYNTIALGTSESHFRPVLAWAPPETETPTKECHFQPEGISRNPDQQAKYHKFLEKNSLAVSRSFRNDFLGSTSKIVPYGFNSERMPIQSFVCREEEINQSSSVSTSKEHFTNPDLTHLEHEHCNYDSYSAFLVGKKMDSHLNSEKSGTSLLRQNDGALLLHDPSTSKNQLPVFVGEQCQKLQNRSGIVLFPSQSSPPEVTKSQRMPCSVHDVETMRICTTVDAVKGLPGGPSKFSQTTQRWLITKKTDVNLSKVGQIFRESTTSTNVKGNTFSKLLSLSPDFGFHGQQGVKLQPLGSSTDSEGKENTGDVKTSAVRLKNESSAETDTMDMDAFQENHLSGATSSPSNKEIMGGKNSPTSQATTASAREEVGGSLPNTKLPDINQELPALPAAATSMHDGEPSTSRTQSLGVEHLLSHAEQPTSSTPCPLPGGPLGPEPSSRWVKRLKLSTSDSFAHGTKSSKMGETSSHEKVNKFFSKIMNCSRTSSEPTLGKRYGKEPMAPDRTAMLLINGESSSMDSVKKDQDITVPLSWIRRWCHNRAVAPQKKPEAAVVCEPQSSNAALDELQKKQFPSIAAMALMGKAVSGFRPCEFRKKGSFVVWNTKGF